MEEVRTLTQSSRAPWLRGSSVHNVGYPLISMQMPKPFSTSDEFNKETVKHIETTLARSLFNCDESAAYAGTALAFRDRLVLDWNKTQQSQTFADQKRVYCEIFASALRRGS